MATTSSKVLYVEGDKVRALIGPVRESEITGFLEIERPGGTVLINKSAVIWIGPAEWRSDPREG